MTWGELLPESAKTAAALCYARAQAERAAGTVVFPPNEQIFRALDLTPPERVKVCIVGQDPYHEKGQANGLAFSVAPGVKIPPSLRNIFKELSADLGCNIPSNGDLTHWAEEGVLLLNTVLTVREGKANSHASWGWQEVVDGIFKACLTLPQPIVFILWGGQARAFTAGLQLSSLWEQKKTCIYSSHPSPLGAHQRNEAVPAFIGSRPFSETNRLLSLMGGEPVNWALD